MTSIPTGRNDFTHIVVGIFFGVDDLPFGTIFKAEHIVPSDVAGIDGSIDRMMGACPVIFQAL